MAATKLREPAVHSLNSRLWLILAEDSGLSQSLTIACPKRGSFERDTIYQILDEAFIVMTQHFHQGYQANEI